MSPHPIGAIFRSMTDPLRIAIAQLNPVVGDLAGNFAKARMARVGVAHGGGHCGVQGVVHLGLPSPDDMVLNPAFLDARRRTIDELDSDTAAGGPAVVIGTPRCISHFL